MVDLAKHALMTRGCDCARSCAWQMHYPKSSARQIKNHPRYAELASEFRGFVTKPHLLLGEISQGSGTLTLWNCTACNRTWVASVKDRISGHGCRKCSSAQAAPKIALARATSQPSNTYFFIDQAIKVVGHPELNPKLLSARSNYSVEWRCLCGQKFNRRMDRAGTYGVMCSTCAKSGSSRIEHEIVFLLRLHLPSLNVEQGFRNDAYPKQVDIYIQELDLVLEIDPYNSHKKKFDVDTRMLAKLEKYYKRVVRVRSYRLPEISGSILVHDDIRAKTNDPQVWVSAILKHSLLEPFAVSKPQGSTRQALIAANLTWDKVRGIVANPASDVVDVNQFFLENLSKPGRSPKYTSQGAGDLCLWSCPKCDIPYSLPMSCFVKGTRCHNHVGEKLRMISMSNPKFPKLKNTHPTIFTQLVRVIEYPDFEIQNTNTQLRQDCLWHCEVCANEWVSKPYVRVKQPSQGCRKCNWGDVSVPISLAPNEHARSSAPSISSTLDISEDIEQ